MRIPKKKIWEKRSITPIVNMLEQLQLLLINKKKSNLINKIK